MGLVMAIVRCAKCNSEFSDFADTCPFCNPATPEELFAPGRPGDLAKSTSASNRRQRASKPIWLVLAALTPAVVASVFTGSIQQHGTFAALTRSTLLTDLIVGAVGMMLVLPGINVAVASFWESQRNSCARRNIYFWWGVCVTIAQLLILVSRFSSAQAAS